jgi:hypothetical protein
VRFAGRFHGRPLAPGAYTIVVVAVRGESRRRIGAIPVEVVPPGRRLTKAERTAVLSDHCTATTSGAAVLPVPVAGPGSGGNELVSDAHPLRPPVTDKPKSRGGVLGVKLAPPHISLPSGTFGWFAAVTIALLSLAGAAFLVFVARFVRGSWNP